MDMLYSLGDIFLSSFSLVWLRIINFVPNIIAAVIVFVVGMFIANFLGTLAARVLHRLYLDRLIDSIGLQSTLEKIGFRLRLSEALGLIVKWSLYAVALIVSADILNLRQISDFLQAVVLYIPNVIIAVVILIVGILVGNFVYLVVKETSVAAKLAAADFLAALAKWAILIFSFMAALIQLRVAPELIQILFGGVVLMIALAGGIAFGYGGKDRAGDLLDRLFKK